MREVINVGPVIERVGDYAEERDYAGYDPYDALNSPIVRFLTLGTSAGRLAWTQFFKRFPFNMRPLFLTPRGRNPKGMGLFLWGYAKLHRLHPDDPRWMDRAVKLVRLLEETRSTGWSGSCWGYNFDWQSRGLLMPRGTPTVVNSSFIGHALLDTWEMTGMREARDMALSIGPFLMNDLNRSVEGGTFCFSYTPLDRRVVHNANLLGGSLLIRLWSMSGDKTLREAALQSLSYSMNHQRPDGSWIYGEGPHQAWIDSFHTGFNLQCIRWFLDVGEAEKYRDDYERGRRFYAGNFFSIDGTPKYYHDRAHPLDIHSPAQAIVFFSREGEEYRDLTDTILKWMIDNLYDKRGFFRYRKQRFLTNKTPFMRWGQAWAFHALTEYGLRIP
jgi:hypothetical protein